MKNLKAPLLALLIATTVMVPALAQNNSFSAQAYVGIGSTGFCKDGGAEWSKSGNDINLRLTSYQQMAGKAGFALVLLKSQAPDFEKMPKITHASFRMHFNNQSHDHVKPTIRVQYAYKKAGKLAVDRFDLNWADYKDFVRAGEKDRYVLNIEKLLQEKAEAVQKTECKLDYMAIGGRELHREGLGKNGFLDCTLHTMNISEVTKDGRQGSVPLEFKTDVQKRDNDGRFDTWSKNLNGTM